MTSLPFNLSNAMFHFNRTGGPPGFLWRYVIIYAAAALAVQLVTLPLMAPIWAASFNPALASDPMAANRMMMDSLGQIMLGYLISIVLGVLLWMMFEAANQRRHMRGEEFRLRLGADEGRVLVVGLIWFALIIVIYIAAVVLIIIPSAVTAVATGGGSGNPALAILVAGIMGLIVFGLAIWIAARLSAAAALTIRDRQIRFFESWRVTKGKSGTLIGAWLLLGLIAALVFFVVYLVFVFMAVSLILPSISAGVDTETLLADFISPVSIAIFGGFIFMMSMISAAFGHVFAGPAALAAKSDPNWQGQGSVAETFV